VRFTKLFPKIILVIEPDQRGVFAGRRFAEHDRVSGLERRKHSRIVETDIFLRVSISLIIRRAPWFGS